MVCCFLRNSNNVSLFEPADGALTANPEREVRYAKSPSAAISRSFDKQPYRKRLELVLVLVYLYVWNCGRALALEYASQRQRSDLSIDLAICGKYVKFRSPNISFLPQRVKNHFREQRTCMKEHFKGHAEGSGVS
jgi:hypothetical protein